MTGFQSKIKEQSKTELSQMGPKLNGFFFTTCLWPLPVHTRMLPGIITPPLLHDPGGNSVRVIHQLEASHIGSALLEFGQVYIHESLVQERNRRSSLEEHLYRWVKGILPIYEYGSQFRKVSSLWEVKSHLKSHRCLGHGVNLTFSQALSWMHPAVSTQEHKWSF